MCFCPVSVYVLAAGPSILHRHVLLQVPHHQRAARGAGVMELTQLTAVYSDTPQGSTPLSAHLWHLCAETSAEKWAELCARSCRGRSPRAAA